MYQKFHSNNSTCTPSTVGAPWIFYTFHQNCPAGHQSGHTLCMWPPKGVTGVVYCRRCIQSSPSLFLFVCYAPQDGKYVDMAKRRNTPSSSNPLKLLCTCAQTHRSEKTESTWIINNTKNVSVIIRILQWGFGARLNKKRKHRVSSGEEAALAATAGPADWNAKSSSRVFPLVGLYTKLVTIPSRKYIIIVIIPTVFVFSFF